MKLPIIDLHCDLLSYLELSQQRTAFDSVVHCSIPQLEKGNVQLQVLAVFTQTQPHSVESAQKQIEIYKHLPQFYPLNLSFYGEKHESPQKKIEIICALENASGLWKENEPFSYGLKRFHELIKTSAKPLYVGLTWHTENRFGGGNATNIGLKEEGKFFLEELNQHGIAIDLSHTSDALANGILDFIEYKNLTLPVIASHSNARQVLDHPRNLPDALAREIFRKQGVVGLNFYKGFVGKEEDFLNHIAHWIELGGENHMAFGADFFHEGDLTSGSLRKAPSPYFVNFQDACSYPQLLSYLSNQLGLNQIQLEKLACKNAENFLKKISFDFFNFEKMSGV